MKIVTNNVPRYTIDAYELTPKERKEFDYIDWKAIDAGNDSATFFRYKGQLYDLGDTPRCDGAFGMDGWDGYSAWSAWSGIVVKLVPDDSVIVGRYSS